MVLNSYIVTVTAIPEDIGLRTDILAYCDMRIEQKHFQPQVFSLRTLRAWVLTLVSMNS